jgi:trehalose 6-phosphate phosphatase
MGLEELTIGLPAPKPLLLADTALFLDLDGTLAPIAARPQDVRPDPRRTSLLERLNQALDGRLAVVSGRTLGTSTGSWKAGWRRWQPSTAWCCAVPTAK